MSKVLRTVHSALLLDCGHIIQSSFRPYGTEVHCPTCADIDERVKVKVLLNILREWLDAQESAESYDDRLARTKEAME